MSKEKLDIKILAKKMELLDIRVKELEEMNIKQFTIVAMASCALLISCKKKEVTPEQIEISTMDYSRRVCPRMINENMTMDSIVFRADAPNDYYYYYTVSGTMDDDYEFPILINAKLESFCFFISDNNFLA